MQTIGIHSFQRSRYQLSFSFFADDLIFNTSYWYEGVDFFHLEEKFGEAAMQDIYFHIAAFELNKLGSLKPETIDLGPFQNFYTPAFEKLWREIFIKVWAQWRYENDLPDYQGPAFLHQLELEPVPSPIQNDIGSTEILAFCGGGKDSLVSAQLLEEAGISFGTLGYSSSVYGTAPDQHALIAQLVKHTASKQHHRQWIFDDFPDAPVLELHPELNIKSLCAAETPASIFGALPIALQHGYRYLVLAHEKSADKGNMIWEKTGEEVNHQWGKSYEAELLLNRYIEQHLISNCQYFSILKPIHDVLIFNMLRQYPKAVLDTHSCNIKKPWCFRCPKCAYVLANYYAYLPTEVLDHITNGAVNIFDLEDNALAFRQMLGQEDHTPFECLGQVEEARLAFELLRMKGIKGQAIEAFAATQPKDNWQSIIEAFTHIDKGNSLIPDAIFKKVLPVLERERETAKEFILRILFQS